MATGPDNNFSWTILGEREVSHFMGQELIYDYITGHLDAERHKAVEKFIFENKEAQNNMMKMLNGIQYVELLKETVVSDAVINRINEPSSYLAVLLKKTNFQRWPSSVKWALEATIVISFIVLTTIFIPWDKISKLNPFPERNETILAEVDRIHQVGDPDKLKELEKSQPAEFADEEKKEGAVKAAAPLPSVTQVTPPVAPAPSPMIPARTTAEPIAKIEAPAAPLAKSPAPEPAPPKEKAKEKEAEKRVGEGSLYRGKIAVTNLDMIGPKIREKILEMGGRKAGEVELGWEKTKGSAYFHFTLPEAKYGELNEFLATYGKLVIGKEKHPRIMPDGIIRLIITVDEADEAQK